ncbi:TRAP transporter substrate-binding protein [Amphritea sp.]|uniref:TRAP transporter substrate-binding protein n=1 Tax=Amphritea sp. TaxID=1872502 RepID=UPI003A9016E1
MTLKKYMGITAMVCGMLGASVSSAIAADYNLRFAHPWPGGSDIHKGLAAWSDSLTEASDGRIKVEFYPAQTLAKAAKAYDAVVNQVADMTATVQGYSANRYPLTQVIELPGMVASGSQGSCILQTLYDDGDIAAEYDDTHVLFVWTNGAGHLHMNGKKVLKPEDIAGLRIRRPTTVVGQLLQDLGAKPVGMPAPDAYTALQRGVIDGVAISWDGAKVFRLNDVVDSHTELNLYSLSFVVTMNKDVYQRLPEDLQRVIDDHSGQKWSQYMAKIFDRVDHESRIDAKAMGDEVIEFDTAIQQAWRPALVKATDNYLDELESKDLPARAVYAKAKELRQHCET